MPVDVEISIKFMSIYLEVKIFQISSDLFFKYLLICMIKNPYAKSHESQMWSRTF